jgi:carbon monoxide dehydrogenase subunit G
VELNNALRIALAPSDVWDALQDLALLRASLDNCESFTRLAGGEYALTLTVPLGPLRARYEVRAHVASKNATEPDALHRALNFKARAEGVGSMRGQIDVTLRPDETASGKAPSTRIDYSVWATLTGPLAELPARQIENALHELADDFFTEFCAVVQAKHGQGPNRAGGARSRRQHVFLRPINLGGMTRRMRSNEHGNGLHGRATSTSLGARPPQSVSPRQSTPHAMPQWLWAVMILLVAVLMYAAHWFSHS